MAYATRCHGAPALAWRAIHAAAHDESIRLRTTEATERTGTITRVATSAPRPEERDETLEITIESGETIHLADIDLIASTPPSESERVVDRGDPRLAANARKSGYRGHCLTKNGRWSTTFTALRQPREQHVREQLANGAAVPDSQRALAELAPEERVSRFEFVGIGHLTTADAFLASRKPPLRRGNGGGWHAGSCVIVNREERSADGSSGSDDCCRWAGVRAVSDCSGSC
jgi:hypothetical protein